MLATEMHWLRFHMLLETVEQIQSSCRRSEFRLPNARSSDAGEISFLILKLRQQARCLAGTQRAMYSVLQGCAF